jgi:hydrogenase nickel incorporation protein HypB
MAQETVKLVKVKSPVMAKNDEIAAENRRFFDAHGLVCANIMSSPGSGKTTLLEAMARILGPRMTVIEGDVQTRRDAERVERAGCRAHQIETHGACHLDAQAVAQAMRELDLANQNGSLLVIENVGNLICPSSYDLGEHVRVGLLSVPEGDDKVLKYPSLFSRISVLVINKTDLLPYLTFDVERAIGECRSLSPEVRVFKTSAKTGEGVEEFCRFLLPGPASAI